MLFLASYFSVSCNRSTSYNNDWVSFQSPETVTLYNDVVENGMQYCTYVNDKNTLDFKIYRITYGALNEHYTLMDQVLSRMASETNDRDLLTRSILHKEKDGSYWLYFLWKQKEYPILSQSYFHCTDEGNAYKCLLFSTQHVTNDVSSFDTIFPRDLEKAKLLFKSIKFK